MKEASPANASLFIIHCYRAFEFYCVSSEVSISRIKHKSLLVFELTEEERLFR